MRCSISRHMISLSDTCLIILIRSCIYFSCHIYISFFFDSFDMRREVSRTAIRHFSLAVCPNGLRSKFDCRHLELSSAKLIKMNSIPPGLLPLVKVNQCLTNFNYNRDRLFPFYWLVFSHSFCLCFFTLSRWQSITLRVQLTQKKANKYSRNMRMFTLCSEFSLKIISEEGEKEEIDKFCESTRWFQSTRFIAHLERGELSNYVGPTRQKCSTRFDNLNYC